MLSVSSFGISDAKTGSTQFRAVTIYTNIQRVCQSIWVCLAEILVLFLHFISFHSMYYSQQMTDDADLLQSNSFMLPLQESEKDKWSTSRKTHPPAQERMPYILHQNVSAGVAKRLAHVLAISRPILSCSALQQGRIANTLPIAWQALARSAILALLYAAASPPQRRECLCRWLGSG